MAAQILWAPVVFWFFLLENPCAHKTPYFRGGGGASLFGRGGNANFIFMGVGIFQKKRGDSHNQGFFNVGEDFYQTYARTRVWRRAFFRAREHQRFFSSWHNSLEKACDVC